LIAVACLVWYQFGDATDVGSGELAYQLMSLRTGACKNTLQKLWSQRQLASWKESTCLHRV